MAASTLLFDELTATVDGFLKEPSAFLRLQQNVGTDFKNFTKRLYDLGKRDELLELSVFKTLPSLVIDNFDDEQIWQELELQNSASNSCFVQGISKLLTVSKADYSVSSFKGDSAEGGHGDTDDDDDDDDSDDKEDDDNDVELSKVSLLDNDDDAMSDISVELEKALDKRIALDNEYASRDGDDDERELTDNGTPGLDDQSDEQQSFTEKRPVPRCTEVDDAFFKLSELEQFLDLEDAREDRHNQNLKNKKQNDHDDDDDDDDNGESIDYFQNMSSSENDDSGGGDDDDDDDNSTRGDVIRHKSSRRFKYDDFFDPPDAETVDIHERHPSDKESDFVAESGSDGENDSEKSSPDGKHKSKSTFEIRQAKLKEKIRALEESNLSQKPWQLMGEVSVAVRPENSLLQEHLQFDHMTRPAPLITEETTEKLEDIIRQRIKDQAWDDVERKIKPKEEPIEYKKRIILDQEKSKLSLAEVYEQEYIKQQQTEKTEGEDELEEHKEIKKAMSHLFLKLDALCNFHFVPRPVVPEVKIVNNLPAIVVEEVAPVSISDANLLAPEEIKEKEKGELKGKTERSVTDRKRDRREKKHRQKKRHKQAIARQKVVTALNPGLGNKYSKIAAIKQLKEEGKVTLIDEESTKRKKTSLTSSKDFFTKLQEEVQTSIHLKSSKMNKKKAEKQTSASKLKL